MSIEELLLPRYKMIADFPQFGWEAMRDRLIVGEIFTIPKSLFPGDPDYRWMEKYPHLFKKLLWYENRKTEDMPRYVKLIKTTITTEVFEANEWKRTIFEADWSPVNALRCKQDRDSFAAIGWHFFYKESVPITKEEYQTLLPATVKDIIKTHQAGSKLITLNP